MRFQRQIILDEIGNDGQAKLHESKVLVVGGGGLAHPVVQYLMAMGIGIVGIIDGDEVSESNLHRQVLFDEDDIGKNKAQVIGEKYSLRKEFGKIQIYKNYLDKKMALDIFENYDVVIDATDNFESKFLINDTCCLFDKPMIYGSVSQFEGQVGVFWRSQGPCYRCFIKDIPKSKIKNCAEAGVVGVLPGIIGTMQAMETLKVLLLGLVNSMKPLIGKISTFDFLNNQFNTLNLKKRNGCLCSSVQIMESDIINFNKESFCNLSTQFLLDVREVNEFSEFQIEGVKHWPLSRIISKEYPNIPREQKIVAICISGTRAEKAVVLLRENGFRNVTFTRKSIYDYKTR